jgi:hypothetical protein
MVGWAAFEEKFRKVKKFLLPKMKILASKAFVLFLIFFFWISFEVLLIPSHISPVSAQGNVYYVAPYGSDSNPGTMEQPFRTIQRAADIVQPGDTVYVREGIYNEEVTIKTSGTPNDYITFKAYPGETVVLDGNNFNLTKPFTCYQDYIRIEGFEIRYYLQGIDLGSGRKGIEIVNVYFHHLGTPTSAPTSAVWFDNATDCLLKNSIITKINFDESSQEPQPGSSGTGVSGGSQNITFEGNEISWVDNGIFLSGKSNNTIIKYNYLHNIYAPDPAHPDFIQITYSGGVEGAPSNIYILYNRLIGEPQDGCIIGIYKYIPGDVYIIGNVIAHSRGGNYIVRLHGENIKVFNNVIAFSQYSGILIYSQDANVPATVFRYEIKNNIFYENGVVTNDPANTVLDYNIYYTSSGENAKLISWGAGNLYSLSEFRYAVGQEQHGFFTDPMFADIDNCDFHLQAGSPAIDAGFSGTDIPTTDLEGNPRYDDPSIPNTGGGTFPYYDIGAYEYQGNGVPDTVPPETQITEPAGGTVLTGAEWIVGGNASDDINVSSVEITIKRNSNGYYWNGSNWQVEEVWNQATITSQNSTSSVEWSYKWVLPQSDGESFIVGARAVDSSGNVDSTPAEIIVTVDNMAPAGSIVINGGATYTTSTAVTVSNSITGAVEMRFSVDDGSMWTSWEPYAQSKALTLPSGDGTKIVQAQFKDEAQNIYETFDGIILDTALPAVVDYYPVNGSSNVPLNVNITVNFSEELDMSTVNNSNFFLKDSNGNVVTSTVSYNSSSYQATLDPQDSLQPDEIYTVELQKIKDIAGNEIEPFSWSFSTGGSSDTISPETTITLSNTVLNGTVAPIYGISTDDIGVSRVELSIKRDKDGTYWDGNQWVSSESWLDTIISSGANTPYATWVYNWELPRVDGETFSLRARGIDIAGNVEHTAILTVLVDNVPPSGSIEVQNGALYTNSTQVIVNNTVSGATEMRFSVDGTTWTSWEDFSSNKSLNLPDGNGERTVKGEFRDGAGNLLSVEDSIILDTQAPQISVNGVKEGGVYYSSVTPIINIADNYEVRESTITLDGSSYISGTLISEEGNHTLTIVASDLVGNITTKSISFAIFKSTPSAFIKWVQPYSTNQSPNRIFYFAWDSTDPNTASFDVEYRPHWFSSWNRLYTSTTEKFTYFSGSEGTTYYLRVRARDSGGNSGPWSEVKNCTIPYDNTSSIFATSGKYWWSVYNSSLYRANSYATTAKNHVFYAKEPLYKVKEVVLIVTKRPNGGKADVYINNRYITTVDFSSSTPKYRVPVLIKKYSSPLPYIWSFKVVTKGKRVEIDVVGVRR